MVKSQLQVYARIKPTQSNKSTAYNVSKNRRKLAIQLNRTKVLSNVRQNFEFSFAGIFDKQTTQEEVFERVAMPVVNNCLEGFNGTVFAYGQTGSGKTFTINGGGSIVSDLDSWQFRGIIPRVLTYLLDQFEARQATRQYRMSVSFMEIYNENAYDLLQNRHLELAFQQWGKVTFYEDQSGIQTKNLSQHQITYQQQGIDLLMMGNYIKKVSSTSLNQCSSRSHCVFTILIEGKNLQDGVEFQSKLHLVDLAGSERVSKTNVQGTLLTEAKSINLSLSYLEQVIIALNDKAKSNRTHIPYRNSLMTTILKDSLGGNCMTSMIANISMEPDNVDQTLSTLRFSQRVGQLQNEVCKNEKNTMAMKVEMLEKTNTQLMARMQQYQKTIKQLKQEKLLRDVSILHNNKPTKEDPIKPQEVTTKVENFLNDKTKKIEVRNAKQTEMCFAAIKELYHNRMKEYVTELSFISEKLHKYDELLTKRYQSALILDATHRLANSANSDMQNNLLYSMISKPKTKLMYANMGKSSKKKESEKVEEGKPVIYQQILNQMNDDQSEYISELLGKGKAGQKPIHSRANSDFNMSKQKFLEQKLVDMTNLPRQRVSQPDFFLPVSSKMTKQPDSQTEETRGHTNFVEFIDHYIEELTTVPATKQPNRQISILKHKLKEVMEKNQKIQAYVEYQAKKQSTKEKAISDKMCKMMAYIQQLECQLEQERQEKKKISRCLKELQNKVEMVHQTNKHIQSRCDDRDFSSEIDQDFSQRRPLQRYTVNNNCDFTTEKENMCRRLKKNSSANRFQYHF